jgi:iron complex transport system permease protein
MNKFDNKNFYMFILVFVGLVLANLFIAPDRSLDFPQDWEYFRDVICNIRLTRTMAAILGGGGLAICGLLMQVWFQNPLADPYVLGIQSGAQLAMTFWIIVFGGFSGEFLKISSAGVSIIGSMAILSLISYFGRRVGDELMIILLGILLGSLCSGISTAMLTFVDSITLKSFFTWNLGSFSNISVIQVLILGCCLLITLLIILKNDHAIDALQLGSLHAKSMGVDVSRLRTIIFLLVGIVSGLITAFCGPLVFLGVISPHLARWIVKTSLLKTLVLVTFTVGAAIGLFSQLIQNISAPYFLSVNSSLNFFAGPVLIFIFLKFIKKVRVVS